MYYSPLDLIAVLASKIPVHCRVEDISEEMLPSLTCQAGFKIHRPSPSPDWRVNTEGTIPPSFLRRQEDYGRSEVAWRYNLTYRILIAMILAFMWVQVPATLLPPSLVLILHKKVGGWMTNAWDGVPQQ